MPGPIQGFPSSLLPRKSPIIGGGVALTLEYVDLESTAVNLQLAQGKGALSVFGQASRSRIQNAIDNHLKAMDIPTLMEKTQARLDEQVKQVKEKLEARYGQAPDPSESSEGLSPQDQGRRLAGYAISLFDSFLKGSASAQPERSEADHRAVYTDLVRGAVKEGFAEARDVFSGLEQMDSDLAARVKATFDEVQRRLSEFESSGN